MIADLLPLALKQRLLTVLVTPIDNLALAQSLKSPVFGCDDNDLKCLAHCDSAWWQGLLAWSEQSDAPPRIKRAAQLLSGWQGLAGSLPVHDLLDRIFHQADVLQRYADAAPEHLRTGVLANLQGFLALSLEHEGGRYPSLPRFLEELRQLRVQAGAGDSPDEVSAATGDAVRMLTIHSAKGLEAPVVFLIKADQNSGPDSAYNVIMDWPPDSERPTHFSLHGGKEWRGPGRDELFAQNKAQAGRERLNLLYVAMTRARQALFISGLEKPARSTEATSENWLTLASEALEQADLAQHPEMVWTEPDGQLGLASIPAEDASVPVAYHAGIGSRVDSGGPEADFGVQVHGWLQGLCEDWPRERMIAQFACDATLLPDIEAAAQRILAIPELAAAFDPARHVRAFNELEFLDIDGRVARIDRLVEFEAETWVLDYKTGGLREPDLAKRALPHLAQMSGYRAAASHLFAGKPVRVALAFADGRVYWV